MALLAARLTRARAEPLLVWRVGAAGGGVSGGASAGAAGRDHRFQSAAELALALIQAEQEPAVSDPTPTPLATQPVPRVSALAVLPFVNMSADPENEFFSDGITEELINALTPGRGTAGDRRALRPSPTRAGTWTSVRSGSGST